MLITWLGLNLICLEVEVGKVLEIKVGHHPTRPGKIINLWKITHKILTASTSTSV